MKKMLLFCLTLLAAASALAQAPPTPGPVAVMGGVVSLSASNSTANHAFASSTSAFPAVLFLNDGANEAFIAVGTSSVTATTASTPVPPGNCLVQWVGANGYFAAITASSTTTIRAIQWNGAPGFSCVTTNVNATITSTQAAPITLTQTRVSLTAATSATLIGANANRKYLLIENTGGAPLTIAPGAVTVTAGIGLNIDPGASSINQGGTVQFTPAAIPQSAFSGISTAGTTITIWEGQ